MSVFISWSGRGSHSHRVAILLKEWLPKVLQKLPCFLSSHDIEAGAAWIKVLFEQLEQSNVGVICLTRSTLAKPWILFEAGALAKKIEASRLCPLLIDLNPSDVEFPLAAFQLKTIAREDVRSLLAMINKSREGITLTDEELAEVFDLRWPQFEKSLSAILKEPEQGKTMSARRSDSELLDEILALTRGIASKTASLWEPTPKRTRESQTGLKATSELAGEEIWKHVLSQARERRPLMVGWLEKAQSVDFSAGVLRVWFSPDDGVAYEAVRLRRATTFVQELINEVAPNAKIEWIQTLF